MAARTRMGRAIATATLLLALGCGGSLASDDAAGRLDDAGAIGQSGAGGAVGVSGAAGGGVLGAGGRAGAGGSGGASFDAGADQAWCAMNCGWAGGLLADTPGGCTFTSPCLMSEDFFRLAVFVDGVSVPMDATHTEGWAYTDASQSAFTLYGQACLQVQAGAPVDIFHLCQVP